MGKGSGKGRHGDYGGLLGLLCIISAVIAIAVLVIIGGAVLGVGVRDANQGMIIGGSVVLGLLIFPLIAIGCGIWFCND